MRDGMRQRDPKVGELRAGNIDVQMTDSAVDTGGDGELGVAEGFLDFFHVGAAGAELGGGAVASVVQANG